MVSMIMIYMYFFYMLIWDANIDKMYKTIL